ncbi:DUF4179 domain-containing protein [Bacillus suaedaesalsae]|uniref:DUF4179 domain-containing protein n=1 Tax=Bacillus suaedaesalsae TaxID=2810349 RepID=A0ABS2DJR6_9BACI|nr:DUF4179 domain-containing protein [Bacillus suaedaesalsae]MBM6618255.1 hypothetical protein [Bacillus suaedaesalsae]
MDNELKKAKKSYSEDYYHSDITTRIKKEVHQRIANENFNQKNHKRMKVIYCAGAAAVAFGLLFGSIFVSPTMAEVAAKIPYLNQILHLKPLNEVIWDELSDKGYQVDGIGIGINGKKEIDIHVKDVNEAIQKDVEKIVYSQLKARGYDAYTVIVTEPVQYDHKPREMTEKEKLIEQNIQTAVTKLKENNYNILTYGYGYSSPTDKTVNFQIDIPKTEKRIEELKNTFHQTLEGKEIGKYSIDVVTIDLEQ